MRLPLLGCLTGQWSCCESAYGIACWSMVKHWRAGSIIQRRALQVHVESAESAGVMFGVQCAAAAGVASDAAALAQACDSLKRQEAPAPVNIFCNAAEGRCCSHMEELSPASASAIDTAGTWLSGLHTCRMYLRTCASVKARLGSFHSSLVVTVGSFWFVGRQVTVQPCVDRCLQPALLTAYVQQGKRDCATACCHSHLALQLVRVCMCACVQNTLEH